MDGRDLLYEDGTFDAVFCASSIEHFGGLGEAQRAIREMERVAKPGGVVAVTTECIVNGKAGLSSPGLELFTPEAILELAGAAEHCAYADGMPPEFTPSAATMGTTYPLASAFADIKTGTVRFPHVVLEHEGREFTSVSIALKKRL
jgi:SAM-dependent methyltransferase